MPLTPHPWEREEPVAKQWEGEGLGFNPASKSGAQERASAYEFCDSDNKTFNPINALQKPPRCESGRLPTRRILRRDDPPAS